ncbi:solute carrier family 2, facilitated glucose transporter member 8-like [Mangifera indica]|uniref:solute carrier family 2, facilitated glucose transporter member 8-like n=1 Tax=Mangifera indica TaxID=29780 RepID=UPI001CF98893|nr:solute carrier family 2, facilitated glucose transporter member 8-like [Mangifera indica]
MLYVLLQLNDVVYLDRISKQKSKTLPLDLFIFLYFGPQHHLRHESPKSKYICFGCCLSSSDQFWGQIAHSSHKALSLVLLSAYYKVLGGLSFVAVAALLLSVGCYQISFGPISWLMVSEIFPLRTRGKGISLAVAY